VGSLPVVEFGSALSDCRRLWAASEAPVVEAVEEVPNPAARRFELPELVRPPLVSRACSEAVSESMALISPLRPLPALKALAALREVAEVAVPLPAVCPEALAPLAMLCRLVRNDKVCAAKKSDGLVGGGEVGTTEAVCVEDDVSSSPGKFCPAEDAAEVCEVAAL